jgi:mono/diheme cytochrome c family protein
MMKRLLLTALAASLAVSLSYADQTNAKVVIPITKTTPINGKVMYVNYCAPCHGVDGKGAGPVAPALKASPTNLTVLSRNNHGKFPDSHIVTVLNNGADVKSHGSVEMPVWGPILGKMNTSDSQDRMLRISNLSRYLDSIQAK